VSARSWLYVPADRPDMLARAHTRGADALIVDLEDAVAPPAKAGARRELAQWLTTRSTPAGGGPEIWVRVNPSGPGGEPPADDLAVAVHPAVTGIVVAKCESPAALARLDVALAAAERTAGVPEGRIVVAALIETAAGLLALPALVAAPRVVRLQVGEADLVAALGMSPGPGQAELLPIRLAVVVHSSAAGIEAPVGPVHTGLGDIDGLRQSTQALARLGFVGRAAVHPAQLPVINEVFTPTEEQVAAASDLLARFDAAAGGDRGVALAADGSLIDEAVVRSARATLARSAANGAG
jgi:citrate lyase subunit beta/citryl-CoA lyase